MARIIEVATVYGGGLALGVALVSVPAAATILTATDGYGLSSNQYGSVFLPLCAGAVLASLFAPGVARKHGLRTVLIAGFLAAALAMGVFALSSLASSVRLLAFIMVLLTTGLLGLGFGSTLTAINAYAASFFPKRSETALTALHTLLGTGTALAPLIVSLLADGGQWWWLPLGVAAAMAILAGIARTQPLTLAPVNETTATPMGAGAVIRALPARFWIWIGFALLYGVCETLFGNWGTVYLNQQRGLPLSTANLALAVFWAAVTIGRLAVALVSTWVPPAKVFRILPVMIAVALAAVALAPGAVLGIIAFGLAGLACSACLPLSIGTASGESPRFVETVSGWMVASYMTGFGIGAFAVGPVREAGDFQPSEIYLGAIVIALVLSLLAFALTRSRRAAAPAAA